MKQPDLSQKAAIALHGYKGSGKSEVAAYLVDHYDGVVVKFADPLKAMLAALLRHSGLSEEAIHRSLDGDLKEVPVGVLGGKSCRYAMQSLGTEWRALVSKHLWMSIAQRRARRLQREGQRVFIDDWRFPEERPCLDELHARRWKIRTPVPFSFAPRQDVALPDLGEDGTLMLDAAAIRLMTRTLLEYCDFSQDEIRRALDGDLLDTPVEPLFFRSPGFIMRTLDNEWRALMERPLEKEAVRSVADCHVSEAEMDDGLFHVILENDGTLASLREQIDRALAA